ncbi:MAG: ShlB/FhaC/HecB family hemolysin secretion/activation protein [Erythrobacter sp.]|nr:ShlB/FhaC/HecB family hemolysin secretion/activation protein [Erythrobacter sp.]
MANLLSSAQVVLAQDRLTEGALRDRTGVNAETSVPEFNEPLPPVLEIPDYAPAKNLAGSAVIGRIEIEEVGEFSAPVTVLEQIIADPNEGISLTPTGRINAAWVRDQFRANDLIGKPVALDQIDTLVREINILLAREGFINSGVLVQGAAPTDGGALKLKLIGGRTIGSGGEPGVIASFANDNARGLSEAFIEKRLSTAREVPFNAIAFERQFRLLAENPMIETVNANLQPGQRPGEARLRVKVVPAKRADVYLSAANNRSPSIGGERYATGGYIRSLLSPGDLLSFESGLTGGNADALASYEAPIIDTRTQLLLRGGVSDAAVVDSQLSSLDIVAEDWNVELGVERRVAERPLLPKADGSGWRAARSVSLGLRFGYREARTELLGEPFSFSPGFVNGESRLHVVRLTGDWVERGVSRVLALSATATQALGGSGSDVPGIPAPDDDFRALRMNASLAQRLGDSEYELRVRVAGQWADGILYSVERFAAGGINSVRGYRETLILADTGLSGSIGLARAFDLSFNGGQSDLGRLTASVFLDGAFVHNRAGPPAPVDEIASIGASLSWAPLPALSMQLTLAESLVDVAPVGDRDLQDRGISFSVLFRPLAF